MERWRRTLASWELDDMKQVGVVMGIDTRQVGVVTGMGEMQCITEMYQSGI